MVDPVDSLILKLKPQSFPQLRPSIPAPRNWYAWKLVFDLVLKAKRKNSLPVMAKQLGTTAAEAGGPPRRAVGWTEVDGNSTVCGAALLWPGPGSG